MTDSRIDELLEPSLEDGSTESIFSVQSSFWVAFLGGPFAVLIFSGLNSQRLGRMAKDAGLFLVAGLLAGAFTYWATVAIATETTPDWLELLGQGNRGMRTASRLLALLLFSAIFLLHRPFHRAAQAHGKDAPSPWAAALGSVGAGTVLSLAIAAVAISVNGIRP